MTENGIAVTLNNLKTVGHLARLLRALTVLRDYDVGEQKFSAMVNKLGTERKERQRLRRAIGEVLYYLKSLYEAPLNVGIELPETEAP